VRQDFIALCSCALGLALFVPLCGGRAETVLYSFKGGSDGRYPYDSLISDSVGNFYGTTWWGGGSGCGGDSCGTIFKVTPSGTETVLYSFKGGEDGAWPYGGLINDSAGNIYGTTYQGGADNAGTVFKLAPNGTETVLHSFGIGNDGAFPYGNLIIDGEGNLYGTTYGGGTEGVGTVFKVAPNGTETVLYAFAGYTKDGANPFAGLIEDGAGNFYGTTEFGGAHNSGTVFKLAPNGTETLLYTFTGGSDGGEPYAGVINDSAGNLYGTTGGGGAHSWGTVFKVAPKGTEKVLYSFTGGNDGGEPVVALFRDSTGNLYGTTYQHGADNAGTVFRLAPNGHLTVLHAFTGGSDGATPLAGLVADKKGNLYSTTYQGGKDGYGIVFEIAE
jgi:uncharacterized repeat protein (TIGR03803 family)